MFVKILFSSNISCHILRYCSAKKSLRSYAPNGPELRLFYKIPGYCVYLVLIFLKHLSPYTTFSAIRSLGSHTPKWSPAPLVLRDTGTLYTTTYALTIVLNNTRYHTVVTKSHVYKHSKTAASQMYLTSWSTAKLISAFVFAT